MNRLLTFGLITICALSSWVLLTKRDDKVAKHPGGFVEPAAHRSTTVSSLVSNAASSLETPPAWPKPEMDVAVRSPFAPPTPPVLRAIVQAPMPAAPPSPPPPAADYRYWGRMSSPEKHTFLFLAKGQDGTPVAIQQGTHLDGGWSVETISDNAIVLTNNAIQKRTTLFVPPVDTTPR